MAYEHLTKYKVKGGHTVLIYSKNAKIRTYYFINFLLDFSLLISLHKNIFVHPKLSRFAGFEGATAPKVLVNLIMAKQCKVLSSKLS